MRKRDEDKNEILEKYGYELGDEYLFDLINSLFNRSEEYMDCKATYTSVQILLENTSFEIYKKSL